MLYPEDGLLSNGVTDAIHNAVIFGRWQFNLDVHEVQPCAKRTGECDFGNAALAALTAALDDCSTHPHLLITVGEVYARLLEQQGCQFHGTDVLYLDGALTTCRSLRSVRYRTFGPSFLAGIAAVTQLKADRDEGLLPASFVPAVGIIRDDSASSVEYVDGFTAGAAYAEGEVGLFQTAIVSATDPASARDAARQLFERGVRVILAAGGAFGPVVSGEAWALCTDNANLVVAENGASVEGSVYVIGADEDQNMVNSPVMLGSIVKHPDHTVRDAMFEAAQGEFASGATTVGFNDGTTEFIYNPAVRRESVQLAVDAARGAASDAAAAYYP